MNPSEYSKSENKSRKEKLGSSQTLEVTQGEFLRLRPIKSPFVQILEQKTESLLLQLNIREYKKRKLIHKIVPTPNYKKIQLDKLGMDIFQLCDGDHRIKDIIKEFQADYRLTLTETEVSVRKYLMMLTERHLIGFLIPQDLVKKNKLTENMINKVIID